MADRELLWLENPSFAAWGCSACSWIEPNPEYNVTGKPSSTTRAAFDEHDCKNFPRYVAQGQRRPRRHAGL